MKYTILNRSLVYSLIGALLFICYSFTNSTELSLEQAMNQNLISCNVTNNNNGSHYNLPLRLTLNNLTNKELKINLKVGDFFEPNDNEFQNIIVSESQLFTLAPNQKNKNANIAGFCTESSDRSPGDGANYLLKKQKNLNLSKLIKFINENKMQKTYEGQNAVWTLMNNKELDNIVGYDTTKTKNLIKFLSQLTGKKIPPPPSKSDYHRNYYCTEYVPKIEMSGNYSFTEPKPFNLKVGLYDTSNICVRELFSKDCPKGTQNVTYKFDASQYNGHTYFVKCILNDRIVSTSEYDLKTYKIVKRSRG